MRRCTRRCGGTRRCCGSSRPSMTSRPCGSGRWRRCSHPAKRADLILGLQRSEPRAGALEPLEAALRDCSLLHPKWTQRVVANGRAGATVAPRLQPLHDRIDDLEPVLRVRDAVGGLPAELGHAMRTLLQRGADAKGGLASLERGILVATLRRRLRDAPELVRIDPASPRTADGAIPRAAGPEARTRPRCDPSPLGRQAEGTPAREHRHAAERRRVELEKPPVHPRPTGDAAATGRPLRRADRRRRPAVRHAAGLARQPRDRRAGAPPRAAVRRGHLRRGEPAPPRGIAAGVDAGPSRRDRGRPEAAPADTVLRGGGHHQRRGRDRNRR